MNLVSVHISFSLPQDNFERRVIIIRHLEPGSLPSGGNFSPCDKKAKFVPGQEKLRVRSLLYFRII